jgi:MFS transporter, DHA1 family, multidrug resistance protein
MIQLFSTVYVALVYGIFYSFLECFPLVYPPIYGFNLGESNLPFVTVVVGLVSGMSTYMLYWGKVAAPRIIKDGFGPPEDRLYYGLYTAWFVPIGLFLFGKYEISWTVQP